MNVAIDDVIKLVSRQFGVRNVTAASRLREDLGAESLDIQNLVIALEDKYGITIDDDRLTDLETVADIHALCG